MLCPPRRARDGTASGARAATLALALVEGRRLLRHPLVIVGAELSLYLHVRGVPWGQMPVVPRDDVKIGYALLPLAAATLLAANWAALRSHRHGTQKELYVSLPASPAQRVVAHLLSVTAPVGLAVGVILVDLVSLMLLGGVGTPNPFELATGSAVVALAGVLGVLLARFAPWIGMASVTAVAFAASWYFPYLLYRITGRVWIWRSFGLFPWFGAQGSAADWADAFVGAWHFAYVVGLVALAACLALAPHWRWPKAALPVALALGLTVVSAVVQVPSPTTTQLLEEARVASGAPGTQVCEPRPGVEYCAWPAYLPWIDRWHQPIAGVLQRLPAAAPMRELRVRQMELGAYALCWDKSACQQQVRVLLERAFADSDVHPTSAWPRGSGQGRAELALAAAAGAWAVDLPTAPPRESETLTICMPREARVVVALWLAGQSTPQAEESLRARTGPREQVRSRLTLGSDVSMTLWPWPEAAYAVALLDRPAKEITVQLQRDWLRWTTPGTPTAELIAAFGLDPVPLRDPDAQSTATGSEVYSTLECE
jgi:hypothetical protein